MGKCKTPCGMNLWQRRQTTFHCSVWYKQLDTRRQLFTGVPNMPVLPVCSRCLLRPGAAPQAFVSCKWRSALAGNPGVWRWSSNSSGGGGGSNGGGGVGSSSSTALPAALKDDLLRGVDADKRDAVARIVEQAQRAADSWDTLYSDFHTPPVVAEALMVLGRMADVGGVAWGGYPQAERCRWAGSCTCFEG